MPRMPAAILIEAEAWQGVNNAVGDLNALVAQAADVIAHAHVAAVVRAAAGDPHASVDILSAAALATIAKLRDIQDPILRLGEYIADRMVTLRLETAEAVAEAGE